MRDTPGQQQHTRTGASNYVVPKCAVVASASSEHAAQHCQLMKLAMCLSGVLVISCDQLLGCQRVEPAACSCELVNLLLIAKP
jgi:hypothetical protein